MFYIKQIGIKEIAQLQAIGRQTFAETFAENNSAENMTKYLEQAFAHEKLSSELNDPNSLFYLASFQDEIIGYLKLNFGAAQTEIKDNNALEIERIYLAKAYHGQKFGQLLYNKAIEVAKEKKVEYIWLGVWEENHRAIQFYTKNGFKAFDKHVFILGADVQTDIMMKLELS